MKKNSEWSKSIEDGITLGPEEMLLREIEKNKALKVDKLRLKSLVETLRSKNLHLNKENQKLRCTLRDSKPLPPQQANLLINSKVCLLHTANILISAIATITFVLFIFFLFFK